MASDPAWHDYMGIGMEKQEIGLNRARFIMPRWYGFQRVRQKDPIKTRMPSERGRHSWALWLPILLEEGCHSAKLHATIHDGHHLLLSIGWQLDVIPRVVWEVSHSLNWMSIARIQLLRNCNPREKTIGIESLR